MMQVKKVKVWYNKGGAPDGLPYWEEEFKGDKLKIKSNDFIEMDFIEACEFKGNMPNIKLNADGGIDPEYQKRITVEYPEPQDPKAAAKFLCQACGDEFHDNWELSQHIAKHHLNDIHDQDVAKTVQQTARRGRPPKRIET